MLYISSKKRDERHFIGLDYDMKIMKNIVILMVVVVAESMIQINNALNINTVATMLSCKILWPT